jgi:hypothetical protein
MISPSLQRCRPLAFTLMMLFAAACLAAPPGEPVVTAPETTAAIPTAPATATLPGPIETAAPSIPSPDNPPAEVVSSPQAAPAAGGPQLAFTKDGDIWLLDQPEGEPYQLTLAGDIVSFAWSPDGERLAAFNGKSICIFHRDGSIRTACLELGLDDAQAQVEREVLWASDQSWIVLWNAANPWDENSIGWLLVALDTTNAMWRIQDPVDWGASLAPNNEPGGVTGQPVFLADGRLIGTLTHRYLCASGGCRYQLFELNHRDLSPTFKPFPNQPEEGWSEGLNLELSPDGKTLTNYGAFLFSCDSFQTFIDRYDLAAAERETFSLDKQAVAGLSFSPDQQMAVVAHTAGCSRPEETAWNQVCGLSAGFEVLPMQILRLEGDARQELPAGLAPEWSPDGDWIAFASCLKENDTGGWDADADGKASIYLTDPDGNTRFISEGSQPVWRPR